jgi:hypothetical protein
MALVFVGSKVFDHAAITAQSCSLTDLLDTSGASVSPAANDVVFVCYVHSIATTANRTLAQCTPSGYSNTHGSIIQANDTHAVSMALSYKKMSGTPDTTVSIPAAAATTNNVSCTIQCWRGVDDATITTTTPTTASGSNTALANPPSISTPSSPAGCVVLGAFGAAQAVATAFTNSGATPYDSTTNYFKSGTGNTGSTNKAASGIGAKTGLAISTAFDAAITGSTTTNTGSWGAAAIVLRPSIATLTPSLFTNSQSFFAPTITTGSVTLTPSLFTNSQSFFAPTITGSITLTPSLFTNSQSFFAPTTSPGAVTLTPALFSNAQTFFAATVSPGAVTLSPPLFTNSQTFHSPTLTASITLTPALFTNAQIFYTPTVVGQTAEQELLPSLFTNSHQFFAFEVSIGPARHVTARLKNKRTRGRLIAPSRRV